MVEDLAISVVALDGATVNLGGEIEVPAWILVFDGDDSKAGRLLREIEDVEDVDLFLPGTSMGIADPFPFFPAEVEELLPAKAAADAAANLS